jgi:hypothetical protein
MGNREREKERINKVSALRHICNNSCDLLRIPQELRDFGVLIYSSFNRGKALFFIFLTALTAIFEAMTSFIIGSSIEGLSA